jgi:hypothetical protein
MKYHEPVFLHLFCLTNKVKSPNYEARVTRFYPKKGHLSSPKLCGLPQAI